MTELLGMTIDRALAVCAQMGFAPEVIYTRAERHPVTDGIARVIRVQEGGRRLVCAIVPVLKEESTDEMEEDR